MASAHGVIDPAAADSRCGGFTAASPRDDGTVAGSPRGGGSTAASPRNDGLTTVSPQGDGSATGPAPDGRTAASRDGTGVPPDRIPRTTLRVAAGCHPRDRTAGPPRARAARRGITAPARNQPAGKYWLRGRRPPGRPKAIGVSGAGPHEPG